MSGKMNYCGILFLLLVQLSVYGQQTPAPGKTISNNTETWIGLYTKYRLSEKLFYYGEYNYRRRNQFINDMGQLYLRFGLTYLVNKQFEVTGGIVTPLYWAPDQEAPNIDKVVPQFRFWQQFLLVQPIHHVKLYHQFRLEQRWRRDFVKNSDFNLTHRFRYKILAYVPLNSTELKQKTLFLALSEEIFMQAGKTITYDHFEDNRVTAGLGYILNDNIQLQLSYMWTFRHRGAPNVYESRHIPRLSVYHSLDFFTKKLNRRKQTPVLLTENF